MCGCRGWWGGGGLLKEEDSWREDWGSWGRAARGRGEGG